MRFVLAGVMVLGCVAAPVVPTVRAPTGGLDVEATSGLGLFADEREQSRALVASALAARDAGLAPIELTARAWALAAQGKNPLTGVACGQPLGASEARKRWGEALGITGSVSSQVWCELDGGCALTLYGRPLDDSAGERFTLVAPLSARGGPLDALSAALPRLAPPPAAERGAGGGLGLVSGKAVSTPLQEEDRLDVRVWNADRDRIPLEEAQRHQGFTALTVEQVQACVSGTDSRVSLLLEVSTAGTIARCEGDVSEDASAASCACGQLMKVAAAPWLAGKRWSVTLDIDRRDQTTSDRRFVLTGWWNTRIERVTVPGQKYPRFRPRVEDSSIEAWTPGQARLAAGCFRDAFTEPGRLTSRWAVWFDGAGQPTRALEQKGFPPLGADVAACVSRALRTAQAPCPSRAGLWAMADLQVTARDPNATPVPLTDLMK
jgi:hypothetical protein